MKPNRSLLWIVAVLVAASLLGRLALASQAGKAAKESDQELNVTYQKVLAIVANPEDRRLLVDTQRAWINFRDANVAFHARYYPESKGGLFVGTDMTEQRIKELKVFLTPESKENHQPADERK